MRTASLILLALAARVAACDGAPAMPAPLADHASVDAADRIPERRLAQVRATAFVLGRSSGGSLLERGLRRLAQRDPARYALRLADGPTPSWFADGGVGAFAVGAGSDPTARAAALPEKVAKAAATQAPAFAAVEYAPGDLPSGGTIAVSYLQRSVEADIVATHAGLEGVFTDTIRAPRIIGAGGGTGGGAVVLNQPYPIELPNVSVDRVATHVKVPAGITADDVGQDSVPVPVPSPRDPRVAFQAMRDAVAAVEHAGTTRVVYVTMPLKTGDNRQRAWFNAALRADALASGHAVLDLADIQSHDAAGAAASNAHGPTLAKDWATPGETTTNEAGEERVARAWWVLMAREAGWTGGTSESD